MKACRLILDCGVLSRKSRESLYRPKIPHVPPHVEQSPPSLSLQLGKAGFESPVIFQQMSVRLPAIGCE